MTPAYRSPRLFLPAESCRQSIAGVPMRTSFPYPRGVVTLAAVAAAGALAVAGVAGPASAATSTTVSTASELKAALKSATAGDTIHLADGEYRGTFAASADGTAGSPITIVGGRGAVLTTGSTASGYALAITGEHWNLSGFSVSTAKKGLVLDHSSGTRLDGLDVGTTGQEAVHVRSDSRDVVVANSAIHDTGLESPGYGEGVYVGSAKSNWASVTGSASTPDRSDAVTISGNTFTDTSAEGIDIKEGTTGGAVVGNVFVNAGYSGANYADSWVDVKGNGYLVQDNSGATALTDAFQVHVALDGWGSGNVFRGNGAVTAVPGYEVNVQSAAAGNVVECAPTGAAAGLSTIACG